ncbi:MAG: hypothetical protein FWC10_09315 [Lentimicrobiaceae bacterium]|nr:hypothetical protein [Lentimicrobiaceae bacterium]
MAVGKHTIKVVAEDTKGFHGTATVSISVIEGGGGDDDESPNFVSFADGKLPVSWKTNTWEVDVPGYDDTYSLRSKEHPASVLTHKTMDNGGYVEFFTKGDNVDLYLDKVKADALSTVSFGN